MSWPFLIGIVLTLGVALLVSVIRRVELLRMEGAVKNRERAVSQGAAQAQLQHPVIDLSRCLGCGTCVAVCPEDGVLELVHGQAMVVRGARCQGISACERECPVGAITITLANADKRQDVPVLTEDLESVTSPGLFLAGEVTAHALIKTAIDHGVAVGGEVAERIKDAPPTDPDTLDLCIVGAGPAGLACSLEAKRQGLRYVTIDQEQGPGGTVAKYPRRKLVLMQPVELPLYGRFKKTSYTKEELVETWHEIAEEQQLPIRSGQVFRGLTRTNDGTYRVHTGSETVAARNVCLALGRRGTPNQLGVPGEDLPKVAYALLDAHSYRGRRVLVVGGGDSAVEAAMALAEQPGNEVTLSYRKDGFFRIRAKNEERLAQCLQRNSLAVVYRSEVRCITPDAVELEVRKGNEAQLYRIANDDVFVMAGGTPPTKLLEESGVSFDPSLRPEVEPVRERGTGMLKALAIGFGLALATLLWALVNSDYYMGAPQERAAHQKHLWLRPGAGLGLALGIASFGLIIANLAYLLRRSPNIRFEWGSLKTWMTSHVATGILALLFAMLHAAMSPKNTVGGHAFWALAVLLITGAIGRYLYAYVPRATNGREMELAEVKRKLGRISEEWSSGQRRFREHARREVYALVETWQWKRSLPSRVLALVRTHRDLARLLSRLQREGKREGIADIELTETLTLARTAHRTALMVAHFEDLRAVLSSWRYIHRWVAALMVLLVVLHVYYALSWGAFTSR